MSELHRLRREAAPTSPQPQLLPPTDQPPTGQARAPDSVAATTAQHSRALINSRVIIK